MARGTLHTDQSDEDPSLCEGARRLGVPLTEEPEPEPVDRTVAANGLLLHYIDWGRMGATPMLLVHGGSTNAHVWDLSAVALAQRYHCLALDQRGHGDSEWSPDGAYDSERYCADLKALIDQLGLAPVLLVGHSMGGSNAIAFTAEHPEYVRKLVIVDAGPGRAEDSTERAIRASESGPAVGSYDSFIRTVQGYTPWWPLWQVRASVRHSVRQLPDGQWTWKGDPILRNPERRRTRQQRRRATDPWEAWASIGCRTLLVRGALSRILPAEAAGEMQQRHRDCRLVTVEGAGHRVMEDNPAAFVEAIEAFLA